MKAINSRVKTLWLASGQSEKDGSDLMFKAFDPQNPAIRLADLRTESGRSTQKGYQHLFSGAMMAIRNPKAHDNLEISRERAFQFLVLASLLMEKLDEAGPA